MPVKSFHEIFYGGGPIGACSYRLPVSIPFSTLAVGGAPYHPLEVHDESAINERSIGGPESTSFTICRRANMACAGNVGATFPGIFLFADCPHVLPRGTEK